MPGFEALLTGRELAGRYRIEEVIGRGGMGAVYRAKDERLGRAVAVKVITVAAGTDPDARERLRARFRHEAASAARLPHHPNVVPVYDYGTDETLGLDFLVMELLRGEDLATRLQRTGPPPMEMALRILQHAAQGVAVGHRSGLIHRDVKPGNVFLVEDDGRRMQVRVLDFGIAKLMEDEDTQSALTQDGRAPLSPAYASPEQLRGDARLNPASDVFSLGALGFQLLTGTRPFTDTDRNRMSLGQEVPVPSLRARNPEVPEAVEQVVRRAVAHDPAERYPDAGALADALEAPLRDLGERPAASYIPVPPGGAAGAPPAGDDDRTVMAGEDDRTMLAAPGAGRPGAPLPPSPRPAGPAIQRPRRRQVPEKSGAGNVILWLALLVALGAAGFFFWQTQVAPAPVDDVPGDTLVVDTVPADTLTEADALVLRNEGLMHLRARNYRAALENFQRAISADPQRAEYRDLYAVALMRMGRYESAVDVLEEALRLDPNYDHLYSHLAEARLALGDTVAAREALQGFLRTTLDVQERERARNLLRELEPVPQPVVPPPPPVDVGPRPPGEPVRPGDTIFIP
jgi:tRNA A-37 threonylcarbamoyl transferase component Bud32